MLNEVAGIHRVRMLYLQLLYRCNFSCRHCFHGELLTDPEQYSLPQAQAILRHFRDTYHLDAVTLLGGEPLLYPDIVAVCEYAQDLGLRVEICTNGHRGFQATIGRLAATLSKLRVSLDGIGATHDAIRQRGSFTGALDTIDHTIALGVPVGATMTVTDDNLDQVVPLARQLQDHGVTELKLHALRMVGNATQNPDLLVADTTRYARLHQHIGEEDLTIAIVYDSDLAPEPAGDACTNLVADSWLDRIESDPRGGLTVSCKAVGRDAHAFRWDKTGARVVYEPHEQDELTIGIPNVVYVDA